MRGQLLASPGQTQGYIPLRARHYPGTGAPDEMEPFEMEACKIQLELPRDGPDIVAGDRIHQPSRWPDGNPEFRRTMLDYFAAMTRLSTELLRAFALALNSAEDFFLDFYRKPPGPSTALFSINRRCINAWTRDWLS